MNVCWKLKPRLIRASQCISFNDNVNKKIYFCLRTTYNYCLLVKLYSYVELFQGWVKVRLVICNGGTRLSTVYIFNNSIEHKKKIFSLLRCQFFGPSSIGHHHQHLDIFCTFIICHPHIIYSTLVILFPPNVWAKDSMFDPRYSLNIILYYTLIIQLLFYSNNFFFRITHVVESFHCTYKSRFYKSHTHIHLIIMIVLQENSGWHDDENLISKNLKTNCHKNMY